MRVINADVLIHNIKIEIADLEKEIRCCSQEYELNKNKDTLTEMKISSAAFVALSKLLVVINLSVTEI